MKFGKLPDISLVDFQLPPDPPFTQTQLARLPAPESLANCYIGCTGWGMKEWVGKVYPPKTPAKEYLWYYSRQFNTIELNTTHYRIPSPGMVEKWKNESAADFKFCPKVPQRISHSKDLALNGELIETFCEAIAGLEDKLGCCFVQLPPYFGVDRLPLLRRFLERWPTEVPLAVEFRHESWFAQPAPEVWTVLQAAGVSTVITDVAGRRDVLHQYLTTDTAMIRFVGNGLHPTDYQRIDEWVKRLKTWLQRGLREVYFFPHEPDNLLAPDLSLYLAAAVQEHCPAHTRGPVFHQEPGGQQMELF
ncbi:MAG: DUF72 domain-containing protein [Bacteroidota bacterium]